MALGFANGLIMRTLLKRLKNYPLGILLSDLRNFIVRMPAEIANPQRRIRSYKPDKPPIGDMLLCYNNTAFFLKRGASIPNSHTYLWESSQIVRTFLELVYRVDVIHENNDRFVPTKKYSIFLGNRTNFHRIARLLNNDCIKILYIDTRHWLFHKMAEYSRLEALKQRRDVVLPARRTMPPNLAIESADYGIVLGNEATMSTYRYAGKPLLPVPISTPVVYPWQDDKNFDVVRKNFLWFGSYGLVHKGLDLVLEAFAEMPEYHLTVCGPVNVEVEKDFQRCYYKELYSTKNIRTVGWVDVSKPEFLAIAKSCLGIVFPSSSEGMNGGVITCMHAGLIPVVSCETGVDVDSTHGVLLKTSSVQEIQEAVRGLSRLGAAELAAMARRNWELARAKHTRETFAAAYASVVSQIMAGEVDKNRAVVAPSPEFAQLSRPS
jgi:glycosyltransferase involved in cell wall biosynthesis